MHKINTILLTKNSRATGNALIININTDPYLYYVVQTDYGNIINMTHESVEQSFEVRGLASQSHKHYQHEVVVTDDDLGDLYAIVENMPSGTPARWELTEWLKRFK